MYTSFFLFFKFLMTNTAQIVMADATVNTPPILSWKTPPPPLTFYPKPRPMTNQTPPGQLPAPSTWSSQVVSVEKKERTVNTAKNFMVDATVNTPPILSWKTAPPPLTFYPKPRPLTGQTPEGQRPELSIQTLKAVSVEKEESVVKTAENVMVNAAVNTPPILSWQSPPPPLPFSPQKQPLTSQSSHGELPALSQQISQQQPLALGSPTSQVQPRALSRQTSEEVLSTISKQALQELPTTLIKQREPADLVNCTSQRPPFPCQSPQRQPMAWPFQGIIQTILHLALLLLTF